MRKLSIIFLIMAGALWAQSDADIPEAAASLLEGVTTIKDLDLQDASIHQAGPDSFYVRSVGIAGADYSLTFTQDSNGIWSLTALNPENDNILPARTVLDFATLTASDGRTLRIDGVFVDGKVYSGSLSVGESAELTLAGDIEAGSYDAVNQARAQALAELAVAESAAAFQAALGEQRLELEAIVDRIEFQRDGYKLERDALVVERDELSVERDILVEELAALAADEPAAAGTAAATSSTPVTDDQVASLLRERNELAGDCQRKIEMSPG